MNAECLSCQVAHAKRENAVLRGLSLDALPGHCPSHGPEYRALVAAVASARLVNAARKGQAMAEDLRQVQGKVYRQLRVHVGAAEGKPRVTPEAAYAKAYGNAPRVVMPLRDPGDRGSVGLYRVGGRRLTDAERAQELALLDAAVAAGKVRRVG